MISVIQKKKIDKKIESRIRRHTKKILSFLNKQDYKVTIVFTDDNHIKELNKIYFNKNKPTNVISFPLFDENDPENILGDIIISVDTALKEANEWGVSLFFELMYLIIHGILHLLGYDHTLSEKDEKIMEEKEREIVNILNLNKWRYENQN